MSSRTPRWACILGLLWLLPSCGGETPPPPPPDAQVPDAAPGCPLGQMGCPCDEGACADDGICDPISDRCRASLLCDCLPHQTCDAVAGEDPICLEACDPGFDWDVLAGRCVVDVCHPDAPGSIADACAADRRTCEPPGRCGPCLPGFGPGPDGCAPLPDCDGLDCEAENRGCVEDGGIPRCSGCLAGWVEFGGLCEPDTCAFEVAGGTAADCAARLRTCVDDPGGPRCGDCLPGQREVDEGGAVRCAPLADCAELGCEALDRRCEPADAEAGTDARCAGCLPGLREGAEGCEPAAPTCDAPLDADAPDGPTVAAACADLNRACDAGRCGGCLPGARLDADTGTCEDIPTCDECLAQGRTCAQEAEGPRCGDCAAGYRLDGDACVPDCAEPGEVRGPTGACVRPCAADADCAAGDLCHPTADPALAICGPDCGRGLFNGLDCVACPPCDRAALGEAGTAPTPTANGRCICATQPDYYYSVAGEMGARPCDVDGDGWLTRGARVALESVDPVVRAQANCTPTTIHGVVLVAEDPDPRDGVAAPESTVWLPRAVTLYESARNDDPGRLRRELEEAGVPRTLVESRWTAHRLNGLTRLCHTATADYDDDGVADVEAASGEVPPGAPPTVAALARFAHFAELHDMRLAARAREPGGAPLPVLRIAERPRTALGFDVDFYEMEDDARDGWRTCGLRRDARYDPRNPRPGFDLADVGLTHHSLFRCLTVRNAARPEALHEVEPLTAAEDYALTRHTARGFAAVTGRARVGEAVWGVARYQHGTADTRLARDYRFGCVDECAEYRAAPDSPPASLGDRACAEPPGEQYPACRGVASRFGQVRCEGVPCNGGVDDDQDGDSDEFGGLVGSLAGVDLSEIEGFDPNRAPANPCTTGSQGACSVGGFACRDGFPFCQGRGATAEVACNDVDEDCDGVLDEDPFAGNGPSWRLVNGTPLANRDGSAPAIGSACTNGIGPCANDRGTVVCGRRGRMACASDAGRVDACAGQPDCRDPGAYQEGCYTQCLLPLDPPVEETCNGRDDDCDGLVDEGLAIVGDIRQGQTERGVQAARCTTSDPRVQPSACIMGFEDCVDGASLCRTAVEDGALDEFCNGLDDDCDGRIDEVSDDDVAPGLACQLETSPPLSRTLYPRRPAGNDADQNFADEGAIVTIDVGLSVWREADTDRFRVRLNMTVTMDEQGEGGTYGTRSGAVEAVIPNLGRHRLALWNAQATEFTIRYTDYDDGQDWLYPSHAFTEGEEANAFQAHGINPLHPTRADPLTLTCVTETPGDDIGPSDADGDAYCSIQLFAALREVPPQDTPLALNTCGNGRCDDGEFCDDGNLAGGDACDPTCTRRLAGPDYVRDRPTDQASPTDCPRPGADPPGAGGR